MLPAFASNFIPESDDYHIYENASRAENGILRASYVCLPFSIRDSLRFTVIVPILLNMHILQGSQ